MKDALEPAPTRQRTFMGRGLFATSNVCMAWECNWCSCNIMVVKNWDSINSKTRDGKQEARNLAYQYCEKRNIFWTKWRKSTTYQKTKEANHSSVKLKSTINQNKTEMIRMSKNILEPWWLIFLKFVTCTIGKHCKNQFFKNKTQNVSFWFSMIKTYLISRTQKKNDRLLRHEIETANT